MNRTLIDIDDRALSLWHGDTCVLTSPSVALLDGHEVITGHAALARRHAEPRAAYERFWQQLNLAPLGTGNRRCRHHADLAYHHLRDVLAAGGRPREVVFTVPADYDEERLALLLGIAGALELEVTGLVDAGVAALAALAPPGAYTLAVLYRHYATLVDLDVDDHVTRGAVTVCEPAGLARMESAWADLVADAFLDQARFDPRHSAMAEQALYDHLPHWLALATQATQDELEVTLPDARGMVSARLAAREFARVPAMVLAPLVERRRDHRRLLLEAGLAALPGAAALFPGAAALPGAATAVGIALHGAALAGAAGGVAFTTRLPCAASPRLAAAMEVAPAVTHLVADGHARRIDVAGLGLDASGSLTAASVSAPATVVRTGDGVRLLVQAGEARLNDQPVTGPTLLAPGDRITLAGGAHFIAIAVE